MPSVDKGISETRLKEYRRRIEPYLPPEWEEKKIDEFIEALFKGVEYFLGSIGSRDDPQAEFREAISQIPQFRQRWLFLMLPLYDESGIRTIGRKYFPKVTRIVTRTENPRTKKTIEELQEEYENL